ncbi:HNH endonuclease signature motif containing protein [Microbacterium sp. 13-71-7]|uniref:HNH endonuclease signature motif containing protein n=1 Tax=Microbacterium sp. 13-71-7 TaxID=1970399 RepID=UPI000BCC193F|nr:HNH endonuclease signature motif containing protein [Microbacterium sp. 13-71-7]OZB85806.1 MAG: hypothetical protein B7X32_01975 [Microbacterium sp. 13-71-7]
MTSTTAHVLEQLDQLLQAVCASEELEAQLEGLSAAELTEVLQAAGRVQRRLDAIITTATGTVDERDGRPAGDRVSPRAGCRDATELLRRALRVDVGTAWRFVHAARLIHRDRSLSSGELLPSEFEELGATLRDGDISVSGLLAATAPLAKSGNRIGGEERAAIDRLLADMARGRDLPDAQGRPGPAPTTDELADFAAALALAVDPDGKEPDDTTANRRRGFTLGRLRDGVVPVSGGLLPEVAGAVQRLIDALNNPAASGAPSPAAGRVAFAPEDGADQGAGELPDAHAQPDPPDDRTPAQKRHDAFAMIVNVAAASEGFPELGGAAPTLVVSVTAEDYARGAGRSHIEGTEWDTSIGVARHTACAGGVQRVLFDDRGQIVSIGTTARLFNAVQRRAIVLRDRECVIPGCRIPATWCEIHHVREWARGGTTHTSNGVALCWHHHRTLESSGWRIRMGGGAPEIRGPHWWDPYGGWHRPRSRGGGTPHDRRRIIAGALAPPGSGG